MAGTCHRKLIAKSRKADVKWRLARAKPKIPRHAKEIAPIFKVNTDTPSTVSTKTTMILDRIFANNIVIPGKHGQN